MNLDAGVRTALATEAELKPSIYNGETSHALHYRWSRKLCKHRSLLRRSWDGTTDCSDSWSSIEPHAINWTHADQVNPVLLDFLQQE
jgi:hypothetical protein